MNYTHLIPLLSLAGLGAGQAAISVLKDSADFAYKYEMDVNPSTQDLDGAGAATDWFAGTAGSATIPQVYSGGLAFSDQAPGAGSPQVLFRTDIGGSIQRESLAGDFTLEAAVRLLGPIDSGDVGGFGIALDPVGASGSIRVNVDLNGVNLDGNGNSAIATASNSDVLHTFRIAYVSADDLYWVWRDDVLLYGTDLSTGLAGTNGNFNASGAFFLGDFTGSLSGEWEVDHIRLDPTASAPIPEPGVALLGGLAGLLLLRRRR